MAVEALAGLAPQGLGSMLETTWSEIEERYELCSLDRERPILTAEETFNAPAEMLERLKGMQQVLYSSRSLADGGATINYPTRLPPALKIEARYDDAAGALMQFLDDFDGRVLFTSDSAGRREQIYDLLSGRGLDLERADEMAEEQQE